MGLELQPVRAKLLLKARHRRDDPDAVQHPARQLRPLAAAADRIPQRGAGTARGGGRSPVLRSRHRWLADVGHRYGERRCGEIPDNVGTNLNYWQGRGPLHGAPNVRRTGGSRIPGAEEVQRGVVACIGNGACNPATTAAGGGLAARK